MPTQKFGNKPQTTLSATIGSGDTSLTVASGTNFPTVGDFHILIDNEIIKVTSVSGTTFTIMRAQESTSGASHSSGAGVNGIVTAGGLDNFRRDNIFSDVLSNKLAAEKEGRLYLSTEDSWLERDTGSAWERWGPYDFIDQQYKPNTGDYTWNNQGSATAAAEQDGMLLTFPAGASQNVRSFEKAVPSAPYKFTVHMHAMWHPSNFTWVGLVLRDSVGLRLTTFTYSFSTHPRIEGHRYTNVTTFSTSQLFVGQKTGWAPVQWFRFEDDNTNRKYHISHNGIDWIELLSESRTAWVTPDKIGFAGSMDHNRPAYLFVDYARTH